MPVRVTQRSPLRKKGSRPKGATKAQRKAIVKKLQVYGDKHIAYRNRFMATWDGSKAVFRKEIEETDTGIKMRIVLGGPTYGRLKWRWLAGTEVRYATMTDDFAPKTARRRIDSVAGDGYVSFVSKLHPHPGIKDREIDEEIKSQLEPEFIAEIRQMRIPMVITTKTGVRRD